MRVTPEKSRMTMSSIHHIVDVIPRPSVSSLRRSGSENKPYHKLISYDVIEEKSAQQLLYEVAQERDQRKVKEKWWTFYEKLENYIDNKKYRKQLVNNLDDKKQWAPLHYAVFMKNKYICNRLAGTKMDLGELTDETLDSKDFRCDINILTGNGENVLHIAARSSSIWEHNTLAAGGNDGSSMAFIKELIKRGADVNHPDDEGRTPLHLAVMGNHLPFVKYLAITALRANILHLAFIPSGQSESELHDMFKYIMGEPDSDIEEEKLPWADKAANFAQQHTLDNRTPLINAVCHPSITADIVTTLIDKMKMNPKDQDDQIQLIMAFEQIAKGRSPKFDHLHSIIQACEPDTIGQLVHFPCRYNNLKLLQWLINSAKQNKKPCKLNASDHAGYTPLLTAVFYRSKECVEYLLKLKDTTDNQLINKENQDGENILHICAKHKKSEDLLDMILDRAASLELHEAVDNNGNLPLHVAASTSHKSVFEKLLPKPLSYKKSPFSIKNAQGQAVVHIATEAMPPRIGPDRHYVEKDHSSKENNSTREASDEKDDEGNDEEDDEESKDRNFGLSILQFIYHRFRGEREYSQIFLERNDDRQTCLHLAAAKGALKIVKFLVETVHLEVDTIADRRLTPLHLACQNGHRKTIAYLIQKRASATLRNAELHNCLDIAIVNQHEDIVKELLTLPNWRDLMRNSHPVKDTEAYDTPMRKLIRYMPNVTIWMIDRNLTRTVGGHANHVFKKLYDYEFYEDISLVRKWYTQGFQLPIEKETCSERWHRRGCGTLLYCSCCCCPTKSNNESNDMVAYTDDAYTLVSNHPLFIAGSQSKCPALVEHPYNICLRSQMYSKYGFFRVRLLTFLLYGCFLGLLTTIILLGKQPEYFFAKTNRNMTNDLDTCAIVSKNLTAANDPEALQTTSYKRVKKSYYAFLITLAFKNIILIVTLFPRITRIASSLPEICALVLSFVYVYDWTDWQSPVIIRCPIQYQIGALGLLVAWINLLGYVKRTSYLNIGIFVAMLQLIAFKFLKFIPVLLVIICGFGFTYWMLIQNQQPFQTPIEALLRTGFLMFDIGYEDRLYGTEPYYYPLLYLILILTAIVFCIFILNLLISLAVGELPSLTDRGTLWQSQMLYVLLSDYSIVMIQFTRLLNCISCGGLRRIIRKKLHNGKSHREPVVIIEADHKNERYKKLWIYAKETVFGEKIHNDVTQKNTLTSVK
ncbi:unnamed protein product [Adineta steineri]|uniref:Ion transport domain-containing protein n=1 Tax=Adineta steineri TaxID=433720 RepID=A0A814KPJ1_9BILA|nr:unnamed protein product [Adineta steineri]CAF3811482.1 unnamed protein product [Adineta steineri]